MINSFRLRLALLSAMLAGLTLMMFGLGSWWLIRNIKIDRIDSEVRTYAEREVNRVREIPDWQRTEARLDSNLGVRDSRDLLLLVQDAGGRTLYQSSLWPAGLDIGKLPWPVAEAGHSAEKLGLSLITKVQAADLPPDDMVFQAGPRPEGWRPRPADDFPPPPPPRRPPRPERGGGRLIPVRIVHCHPTGLTILATRRRPPRLSRSVRLKPKQSLCPASPRHPPVRHPCQPPFPGTWTGSSGELAWRATLLRGLPSASTPASSMTT